MGEIKMGHREVGYDNVNKTELVQIWSNAGLLWTCQWNQFPIKLLKEY